jgi:protein disulfide-isomerase A6
VPKQHGPLEYNGPRTAAGLVDFIVPHIPSQVQRLSSVSLFETFLKNDFPKAILFSAKSQTPYLFKALSITFGDTILFGQVKHSQTDIVNQYNVTQFPTLLFWEKGQTMPKKYQGPMKHAGLSQFFRLESSKIDCLMIRGKFVG